MCGHPSPFVCVFGACAGRRVILDLSARRIPHSTRRARIAQLQQLFELLSASLDLPARGRSSSPCLPVFRVELARDLIKLCACGLPRAPALNPPDLPEDGRFCFASEP